MENLQKLHPRAVWIFFFRSLLGQFWLVFFLILVLLPMILSRFSDSADLMTKFPPAWIYSIVLVILIIFDYIWARLTYHFWRYQLTDNAVKIEKGVIWKRYVSIPHERVQNVDIYRGLIARILGLSDIHIQTAGFSAGGKGRFTEGRLPGLSIKTAEDLREELIKRVQGTKQGL